MKKVVRMLGLCALVALAFTSCKKKETNSVTFKAGMPTVANDSRTYIVGAGLDYWLQWSNNDVIKVIDTDGEDMDFTLTNNLGQNAEFEVKGTEGCDFLANLNDATKPYSAFYPVNPSITSYTTKGGNVTMTISPEQQNGGYFGIPNNSYPMVAVNNGDNFDFTSEAGFIVFTFTTEVGTSLHMDKVVLTSSKTNDLTGDLIYNYDGTYVGFVGSGSVVTSTFPRQEVSKISPVSVTFVLPMGALSEGFTVDVYDGTTLLNSFTTTKANTIQPMHFTEMVGQQLN